MNIPSIIFSTGNKGKLKEFKGFFENKYKVFSIKDLVVSDIPFLEPIENSDYFLANCCSKIYSLASYLLKLKNGKNIILNNFETQKLILSADDSGLIVPQMDNKPGVHSAYYAGFPSDEVKNNLKLMKEVEQNRHAFDFKNEKRLKAFFISFISKFIFDEKFIIELEINDKDPLCGKLFETDELIRKEIKIFDELNNGLINNSGSFNLIAKGLSLEFLYGCCNGYVSNKSMRSRPDLGHGYDPIFYPESNINQSFASIELCEKNKISHRALACMNF